jgi:signal transduction histidine kinase
MPQKISALRLSRFYILALSGLAFLVVCTFAVLQYSVSQQREDATLINMSGNQRMLSQQISYWVMDLEFHRTDQSRKKLSDAASRLLKSHYFLTTHNPSVHQKMHDGSHHHQDIGVDFYHNETISSSRLSEGMNALYFDKRHKGMNGKAASLDDLIKSYVADVSDLLKAPENELVEKAEKIIGFYPDILIPLLNGVVTRYETESQDKIDRLILIDDIMLLLLLGAILASGFFIFRPMERKVQAYAKSLQDANQELEKRQSFDKLAALGELSGGIAHEINNALQPIVGLSDIILRRLQKMDEPKLVEYMSVIQNSGDHATKIVSGILAFARNQKNDFKIYSVFEIAKEATDFTHHLLPSTMTLHVSGLEKLRGAGEMFMKCDKTGLSQVITNLLKNASDSMEDTGELWFSVGVELVDIDTVTNHELMGSEFIVIRIIDSGSGMPKEVLDKIFDPFFTTKEEGKGTGLGLSVSYGIIKSHGGTILVESELGEGTEFIVILPLVNKDMHDSFLSDKKTEGSEALSDLEKGGDLL